MRIQLLGSDIWNTWFYNDEVLYVLRFATRFGLLIHTIIQSRDLHMRLAESCVARVLSYLRDATVSKLWRAKGAYKLRSFHFLLQGLSILLLATSYASSRNETSFMSYFASTTPESEHKRARLKTVLILAGSSLYDPEAIRQQLLESEKILKFELAIIDGKVCSVTCFIVGAL
jgi:vacuolar protein sorting-associated protein 3